MLVEQTSVKESRSLVGAKSKRKRHHKTNQKSVASRVAGVKHTPTTALGSFQLSTAPDFPQSTKKLPAAP